MEVLPRVITKLGELLDGEYMLQKAVKGEIVFLKAALESIKGALEKVSSKPEDQLDVQDRIRARDLRELSYDTEDCIDIFMVRVKDEVQVKSSLKSLVHWLDKINIVQEFATEIRDIKNRVVEMHRMHKRRTRYFSDKRHARYDVNLGVDKPATDTVADPRLFSQYTEVKELVGIDETRDELIKILMEASGVPLKQGKIVSIFGFARLGKTTLAKAVYEKTKGLFDCCAFVSVSQNPDLMKIFKGLLCELGKNINEESLDERVLIDVVREFLKTKRYFLVIDDIWNISIWQTIRRALPDNDVGYIIITTTRNFGVAEEVGGAYKMKPLSLSNSQQLLYRRIFGKGNKDSIEDIGKMSE